MKLAAAAGKEHIVETKKVDEVDVGFVNDAIPGLDENHPDHAHHCELVDHIKKTNPALYKKMLAWG
jgi:hypothetical protein